MKQIAAEAVRAPVTRSRTGIVLSALCVLFLTMDGVMKLVRPAPVLETMAQLGYPSGLEVAIGVLLLVCVAIYVNPSTSVLGAVLLTGYLGGAVATHVRVGNPLLTHVLFPVHVGLFAWAGLFLRERRLRELLPFRR